MPRYIETDTITFTDKDGNSYELKDTQEIIEQAARFDFAKKYDMVDGQELDEIAQKREIFGELNEPLYYQILDFNAVRIAENDYDITGLGFLNIPVRRG